MSVQNLKHQVMNGSRRSFLKAGVATGGGLLLTVSFPSMSQDRGLVESPPLPHVFLTIKPDNTVIIKIKHLDMGQGTATGLASIAAEELDADWDLVRYEYASADITKFKNGLLGVQGTGVSTSIANSWTELRKAGAAARQMLIQAASQHWKVSPEEISTEKSKLIHKQSGQSISYGLMAKKAAEMPVPQNVILKNSSDYRLVGQHSIRKLDGPDKTTGKEIFGLDLKLPGMVYATLARPPKFGAKLKSFDASKTRAIPAVLDVLPTKFGVAVIASNTWAAMKGRDALTLAWDFKDAEERGSDQMLKDLKHLLAQPAPVAKQSGNEIDGLETYFSIKSAEYSFPFLAHAPMEPLNATVELTAAGANLYTGCQFQTVDQMAVAQELGLQPALVNVVTLMAGGSFGRRANPASDYVREAAVVAKAYAKAPVKLVWNRQDDLHGGYYRSMFVHQVKTATNHAGEVVAWDHKVAGHSIAEGTGFARFLVKNGIDHTSEEGSYENKYALPNFKCTVGTAPKKVPVLWWRSVGHTHGVYVTETMADEMAASEKSDPLAWRLNRLNHNERLSRVIREVGKKSNWDQKLPLHYGRGIAAHSCYGSHIAHVVEVQKTKTDKLKISRVVCVIDCGIAVNPDIIKAQVEGGVAFALSAALFQKITFKDGFVQQDNFHQYPMLSMKDMPKVEVHILDSKAPPTGVGEPVIPTVAPALANAIFAVTGKRMRSLPFSEVGISLA
jgi:isoquinoline 1-oxidoreductase beta subunit